MSVSQSGHRHAVHSRLQGQPKRFSTTGAERVRGVDVVPVEVGVGDGELAFEHCEARVEIGDLAAVVATALLVARGADRRALVRLDARCAAVPDVIGAPERQAGGASCALDRVVDLFPARNRSGEFLKIIP